MAGKSPIEWTEHTWNPIVGCSIVSPGCTNCYAMKMAARIEAMAAHPMAQHVKVQTHYAGTTKKIKGKAIWTGKLALAPDHILLEPLKRKKPTTYFVNSMGDLFHENVPDEWIDRVFAVMALCPQHTFQVLTKRAERMRDYVAASGVVDSICNALRSFEASAPAAETLKRPHILDDAMPVRFNLEHGYPNPPWPLPNVWLGVSTERQQEADERIPLLLQTPAAVRFISAEPLLGEIDLTSVAWPKDRPCFPETDDISEARSALHLVEGAKLDWVIVGGESGPDARPMHPDWARSLRDQCAAAGVPFFFKQWGSHAAETVPGTNVEMRDLTPNQAVAWGDGKTNHVRYTRVGKKNAGRLLDGKEHNGFPVTRTERAA